ncbi:MAG: gamma carbonic anhydrase family protein [Spirochaetes bacterium]|nr:gamma carbonic anhydrase family protein [Spirochaetota bacterium]
MIVKFQEFEPQIHETAFIAPTADIIGDVIIGKDSSVWFNTVIRGDMNYIRIGERTNIQDLTVIHITNQSRASQGFPVIIGDDVTVGHSAVIHACEIQNACLIGMGSIILDGAVIGEESIVGAGSLVTKGKIFPSRSLIMGSPAGFVRLLAEDEVKNIYESAANYVSYKSKYV